MKRIFLNLFIFAYIAGLFFFYVRYVPLVKSFQAAFLPVLFAVFGLTLIKREWGLLFFIFSHTLPHLQLTKPVNKNQPPCLRSDLKH